MKQISFLLSWICVGLMLICLLSGIIVTYVYYPNEAYESVALMSQIPYGSFFRKMHYFSGELFLITALLHVVFELIRDSKNRLSKFAWFSGIVALIATLLLMFSGYVLKGDLSGQTAAQVAFAMISNTPILEYFLPFFKDTKEFFWRFFILHCFVMPIVLLYFLQIHSKKIFTKYILIALTITLAMIGFIDMPKDLNPLIMVDKITGPWFFLGGENLLVEGVKPPIVVLFLATPFILLTIMCFFQKKLYINLINLVLVVWLILYAYLYTI